ncbi:uncharacterized protein LOC132700541 [Cylas formicarius]|uniref:uncharacterized protein LOC132700541 n=1 Tax=Cylas formicarius TaxID=197179 RepID=UPI002958A9AD|nr:uncharacterized protein LOC132700541 [Cylas formicarius]
MPKYRDVQSLKSLSLKGVGSLVVFMAPRIVAKLKQHSDAALIKSDLQRIIDSLKRELVSYVPDYLYDSMAVEVLKSVKALIEKTKKTYYPHISMSHFLTEMNVVVSLAEVVLDAQLRNIDFSEWPKIMRYVLYKNLDKLTGLENLNLGSCTASWKTSEHDNNILSGIRVMKHLRSLCLCFDCTDLVIQAVGENCPHIKFLDVTCSRSVTDRSIPHLLKCRELTVLQLHQTSVTKTGIAQLIAGLPKLEDVGRCDELGHIIKHLYQNFGSCGPFTLRKIQTRDLSTENLRLAVDMFPNVEQVSLFHDEQISDLTVLISLDRLRDLKLLSCAFYSDYLKQLLEIRGSNLTSLHLEHAEEMNFNALLDISQCCPQIKSLVFYNCDFTFSSNQTPRKLKVAPFQKLEKLFWVVDSATNNLEFILSQAVNIKRIHLGSSTGITHSSIVSILNVNPMKQLEEFRVLYSSDMNMRTVELLLASCTNLRVLSELESWQGISVEELKQFKKCVCASNFDLDVRPTLSFSN